MKRCSFLTAAFAVLLAVTMYSCHKPMGFEYRGINNVKLENASLDKATVMLNMVYYNPNSFGVNLKHVECDVYVDSGFIGRYTLDTMMHIDGKAEFTMPARMNVDVRTLFKGGMSALFGNKVNIMLKGNTRVGKGGLFISVPIDFSGKYSIPLF